MKLSSMENQMQNLIQELWNFTENVSSSYSNFHKKPYKDGQEILRQFLFATMDEVRLKNAATYSKGVLALSDMDDLDHFRIGLLRREINGEISYPKQRDHSAHTLYNYLLGWYFYDACPELKGKLETHFKIRNQENDFENKFGGVWPFVSIAHDLGYLLEGLLAPLATETQDSLVSIGASVIQEYFSHTFWTANKFDSTADRELLLELCNTNHLNFTARTLSGISDSLRNLGNLDELRKCIKIERGNKHYEVPENDCLGEQNGLSGDAFDLWEENFQYFNNELMVERLRNIRKVFDYILQNGIEGSGTRFLDHGVCSGLILLLYSTYYFKIYFGLPNDKPTDKNKFKVWDKFRHQTPQNGIEYQSIWWWSNVLRGTACTAIHNIQQMETTFLERFNLGKLQMDEEPLAYLGIMVDIIQEWDRTTVRKDSIISGILPVQGIDCKLGNDSGKVILEIPNTKVKNRIVKNLTESLVNWENYLTI